MLGTAACAEEEPVCKVESAPAENAGRIITLSMGGFWEGTPSVGELTEQLGPCKDDDIKIAIAIVENLDRTQFTSYELKGTKNLEAIAKARGIKIENNIPTESSEIVIKTEN